jgi:SAM-dependent methyltransferase
MSGVGTRAIWHDVECGAYSADLQLWEELATEGGGPVLELGCGTGRVALHLARRGHPVVGLDLDPELLAVLTARATGVDLETVEADACEFELDRTVSLALAPMQVLQLLDDGREREECLARVAASLRPGGRFAAAIIERMPEEVDAPPPLPDVHDIEGWIYSSLSVEAAVTEGEIVIHRLRQTVSPSGELSEEPNEIRIATFEAAELEAEGRRVGLIPVRRLEIPPTDIHVGSTVVVLGKEA